MVSVWVLLLTASIELPEELVVGRPFAASISLPAVADGEPPSRTAARAAVTSLEHGDLSSARSALKGLDAAQPQVPSDVRWVLARVLMAEGKWAKAVDATERALEVADPSELVGYRAAYAAVCSLAACDPARAFSVLKKSQARGSTNSPWELDLAEAYAQAGLAAQALAVVGLSPASVRADPRAQVLHARAATRSPQEAARHFVEAARAAPESMRPVIIEEALSTADAFVASWRLEANETWREAALELWRGLEPLDRTLADRLRARRLGLSQADPKSSASQLPPLVFRRTAEQVRPMLRACLTRGLVSEAPFELALRMRLRVDANGVVRTVSNETAGAPQALMACTSQALRATRFPLHQSLEVVWPLRFRSMRNAATGETPRHGP